MIRVVESYEFLQGIEPTITYGVNFLIQISTDTGIQKEDVNVPKLV